MCFLQQKNSINIFFMSVIIYELSLIFIKKIQVKNVIVKKKIKNYKADERRLDEERYVRFEG